MSTRRRGVSAGATSDWTIEGIGGRVAADNIYAPAGIALATQLPNERAWVQTVANHFELYYVMQPGGGSIDVELDGVTVLDEPVSLAARVPRLGSLSFDDPEIGLHRVDVRTVKTGKVRLLGIVSEQINAGVVFDVFGVNGARASRMLGWNPVAFADVLKAREPNLVIVAFGTNEAADPDWTPLDYEQLFGRVLRRIHAAVPTASILVYGPPDRGDTPFVARRMPYVIEAERRTAFASNAAFWNSYAAMGGAGSMRAWTAQGFGQADHVHLTAAGYLRIADLFYEDLMRAFRKWSVSSQ